MVTFDSSRKNGEGNAYEFNALGVLQLYSAFVEGDPNCTLAIVSSAPLSQKAQDALRASAERLGYGKDACAWIVLAEGEGKLGATDLRMLLEGLDPVGIVASDAGAASAISSAYEASMQVDSANRVSCRTVVALSAFEDMMDDKEAKQKAWAALKKLAV